MAAPTIYRSSDASAPVLTGTAGDLVNLLDKCLADGYGAKSALGWTKSFTATNQRSYRQAAGNQFYLDVDDRGATSVLTGASGKEAAVRAYEAMTAVSTGTNPFPTAALDAVATANWRKSASADTVPRGWFLIGDDRTFILGILTGDSTSAYQLHYFGDIYSLKTGDGFRTIITTRSVVNNIAATGCFCGNTGSTSISGPAVAGMFLARTAAGTGTAITASLIITGTSWEAANSFVTSLDGNIWLSRLLIGDPGVSQMRGYFRGCYELLTPGGLNDGDTITGTGDFTGRTFVVAKGFISSTLPCLAIETTAWDTSS